MFIPIKTSPLAGYLWAVIDNVDGDFHTKKTLKKRVPRDKKRLKRTLRELLSYGLISEIRNPGPVKYKACEMDEVGILLQKRGLRPKMKRY